MANGSLQFTPSGGLLLFDTRSMTFQIDYYAALYIYDPYIVQLDNEHRRFSAIRILEMQKCGLSTRSKTNKNFTVDISNIFAESGWTHRNSVLCAT